MQASPAVDVQHRKQKGTQGKTARLHSHWRGLPRANTCTHTQKERERDRDTCVRVRNMIEIICMYVYVCAHIFV